MNLKEKVVSNKSLSFSTYFISYMRLLILACTRTYGNTRSKSSAAACTFSESEENNENDWLSITVLFNRYCSLRLGVVYFSTLRSSLIALPQSFIFFGFIHVSGTPKSAGLDYSSMRSAMPAQWSCVFASMLGLWISYSAGSRSALPYIRWCTSIQ